jgi:hypothetical protein
MVILDTLCLIKDQPVPVTGWSQDRQRLHPRRVTIGRYPAAAPLLSPQLRCYYSIEGQNNVVLAKLAEAHPSLVAVEGVYAASTGTGP